ncbi:MAG: histidinol-phosphatase [Pirellulaceae bacterium]
MTENPRTPAEWSAEHDGRLEAMISLAHAAAGSTLNFFNDRGLTVDRKGDASPVTEADRNAERLFRKQLAEQFADDAVLGEEFEEQSGASGYRWIGDPIDGTKSFICGVPLYSTLVGLQHDGEMIGGVIAIPALGESVVAAHGFGAWHRSGAQEPWQRAQVSSCNDLAQATFVTSQVDTFASRGAEPVYRQLESAAYITRSWGDGYGYLLVATGRAEVMVDPIVNAWDVGAILPVVREAGGRFTDWKGDESIDGGDAFGTNGLLHQDVIHILNAGKPVANR